MQLQPGRMQLQAGRVHTQLCAQVSLVNDGPVTFLLDSAGGLNASQVSLLRFSTHMRAGCCCVLRAACASLQAGIAKRALGGSCTCRASACWPAAPSSQVLGGSSTCQVSACWPAAPSSQVLGSRQQVHLQPAKQGHVRPSSALHPSDPNNQARGSSSSIAGSMSSLDAP